MEDPTIDEETLELAAQDVRRVIERQKEERQILITQMNILFVTNTALLSFLTISRLIAIFSLFSVLEILLLFFNFMLLIRSLLPRKFFVSPNLETDDFQNKYLKFSPQEYQSQMLVNLRETYNQNQKQVENISQSLTYATFVTAGIAFVALLHQVTVYFIPELQKL
ncbi:hypothetical protein [Nostoc sphaeroides]|uniref:Uncharacterized protein n=1 Tax=Nostoc sphaeroides CCNUC1 TaxID=2653204 RepID=A0A5P8W3X8_9NOSO|nr:hypothetical protein [Nostoc sphaeroides]MCC5630698.1 hypothetical protein [Nostoc sphaeroides CHAB 2801]QFS46709.1 hypothetical protein GXM_04190 [Nostoc sphaeroides CCNUC1]